MGMMRKSLCAHIVWKKKSWICIWIVYHFTPLIYIYIYKSWNLQITHCATWYHRNAPALVQLKDWCHLARNHHMKQCWQIINEVLWHSSDANLTGNYQGIYPWYEFQNCKYKITALSPMGQWVNITPDNAMVMPVASASSGKVSA